MLQAHGFSQEASFLAAPTIGPESHVKFLAIADMGQAEVDGSNEESEMIPALNTTRLMIAEAGDKQLLIHNGDISYARYDCAHLTVMVTKASHTSTWWGSCSAMIPLH